jgi:hypothetical protein
LPFVSVNVNVEPGGKLLIISPLLISAWTWLIILSLKTPEPSSNIWTVFGKFDIILYYINIY